MKQLLPMIKKRLSLLLLFIVLPFSSAWATEVKIVQVDVLAGYYSLKAKTENGEGQLSRFGIYKLGFRRALLPKLEFGASYSFFTSQLSGGDLGFGPDLSMYYYPVTNANPFVYQEQRQMIFLTETWRPFLSLSFHQRNFQSFNSSFAGFGAGGGFEMPLINDELNFRSEVRALSLLGPSSATAFKIDVLVGVSFSF